jgi:hypothetical protein
MEYVIYVPCYKIQIGQSSIIHKFYSGHRFQPKVAISHRCSMELLDLIGEMIVCEGEKRLLVLANPNWPHTGPFTGHTMFMEELYKQHCVNLHTV